MTAPMCLNTVLRDGRLMMLYDSLQNGVRAHSSELEVFPLGARAHMSQRSIMTGDGQLSTETWVG